MQGYARPRFDDTLPYARNYAIRAVVSLIYVISVLAQKWHIILSVHLCNDILIKVSCNGEKRDVHTYMTSIMFYEQHASISIDLSNETRLKTSDATKPDPYNNIDTEIKKQSKMPLWRGQFSSKSSQQATHTTPVRARCGVFWVLTLMYPALSLLLQYCMQHHDMLDRINW